MQRFCGCCVAAVLMVATLKAAPQRYNYGQDQSTAIQEIRDSIDDLRHEMRNHESEIRTYEDKLSNQENIIDALREQITKSSNSQQDQLKNQSASLEMKVNQLETATKGLSADLRQFKTHANETTTALHQITQRMAQLEKVTEVQNQNLDNLQAALRSMMDALDIKSSPDKISDANGKNYKVKAGDSLEKIARANGTTIKAIKELNNLANDRIVVGQTLKMP